MIPPDQLIALFRQGPVLLLADGDDPLHKGLPDSAHGCIVVAQLAGDEDRDCLMRGTDPLPVRYTNGKQDDTALLAAAGMVGLIGRGPHGEPKLAVRPQKLHCLGPEPQLGGLYLLAGLGLAPMQPVWSYPSDLAELDALREQCEPSKPAALMRAREAGGAAWLGLHKGVPGLEVLMPPHDLDRHDLLLVPETKELQVHEAGVSWRQAGFDGVERPMHVPWSAVWAVRSVDLRLGWSWPGEMPPSVRGVIAAKPELWLALAPLQGVPMPAVPPAPRALVLAPPSERTPRQAVQWSLRQGSALILVDACGVGVEVPQGLSAQPVVAVPVGMPPVQASLQDDDEGLTATIPDADGTPGRLRAPWASVLSVTSFAGAAQMSWNWPDHASLTLQQQMRHDRPGHAAIALDQPVGPHTAQGQAMLHIEFELQRNDLN